MRHLNFLAAASLALGALSPVVAQDTATASYNRLEQGFRFSGQLSTGQPFTTSAGLMNMSFGDLDVLGYCVDLDHAIWVGWMGEARLTVLPVEDPWCTISHIVGLLDPTSPFEGSAVQVAIWKVLDPGLTVDDPTLEEGANGLLAMATGACPLDCADDVSFTEVVTEQPNGDLIFDILVSRGVGPAVSFQDVAVEVTGGSLNAPIDGVAKTDDQGVFSVEVTPIPDVEKVVVDLEIEGRTLFRIEPLAAVQQIMFPEECIFEGFVEWSKPTTPPPFIPLCDPRPVCFWTCVLNTALSGGQSKVPAEELEAWFPVSVFGITFNTLEEAFDFLSIENPSVQQAVIKQALAAELNLLWAQVGETTEIDIDGDLIFDFTFEELILAAKGLYDDGMYEEAESILAMFNAIDGDCGDCCPPREDCGECKGKITELTLKYNGVADAFVEVIQKKDGLEAFSGAVAAGGEFSFTGQDDKGTLSTEIIIHVNGVEHTRIHTSCSDPDVGPGYISGDFEVIAGASREGGALCASGGGGDPGGGCGDCKGKITELTLKYNGVADAFVEVIQKKDGLGAFSGAVAAGGEFSFTGQDDKGTLSTEIIIHVNGVEHTRIHTSCSDPDVGPGYISGDFEVIAGASREGGALCASSSGGPSGGDSGCGDCDGKITALTLSYDGSVAADVQVLQKKDGLEAFSGNVAPGEEFSFTGLDDKGTLGTEIIIYVDGDEHTRIHTSCSDPDVGPGYVSGNFTVLAGASRNGGALCPTPVDIVDCDDCETECCPSRDCAPCEGKITDLTLSYQGSDPATVEVKQKKDGTVVYIGEVVPGEEFSFSGADDKGTLGTEIIISVDDSEHVRIHTSCSDPDVGPGYVAGDFVVVAGASREGGVLCESGGGSDPSGCGKCEGKITELELRYNGGSNAGVTVIQEKTEDVVFTGTVAPGGVFSFEGMDDKGTLGTWITINVGGVPNARIHTSCSDPDVGPGYVAGDFEVISGKSLNGGVLCAGGGDHDSDKDKGKDKDKDKGKGKDKDKDKDKDKGKGKDKDKDKGKGKDKDKDKGKGKDKEKRKGK